MDASVSTTPARSWAPRFFTIWGGQAISLLGSMLVQFALVWWLTSSTGSATVLATATLAAVLPQVIIGPFAGALVDRWNRRLVMIVADSLIAVSTGVLIALSVTGQLQIWHVYAAMFWRSALGSFHWTAMQASTSLMVPHEQLSRVAGLNQTLNGAMGIIAPPLGALLVAIMPMPAMLSIDIFTALLAVVPLLFIAIPQPVRTVEAGSPQHAGATSVMQDFKAGLRYVRLWPGLLAVMAMAMVINFIVNPAFALMPILVTKHFGGGAPQLGFIESAWAVGIVIGGLVLSVWGGFKRSLITSLMGVIGMGVGILVIGFSPAGAFLLALAGMFIGGFMNPMANGPLMAVLQKSVSPDMQGRVMSLLGAGSAAMMPLSLLIAGPVADALGVRVWYIMGGAACVLLGAAAFFVPAIRNLESNGNHARVAAVAAPVAEPVTEVAVAET
jgi:MFS transporter, DHA3 family, macrolide efflux protein